MSHARSPGRERTPLSRPKQVGWSGFLTFNMSHIIKVFKHRPIKPDLLYILKSERTDYSFQDEE